MLLFSLLEGLSALSPYHLFLETALSNCIRAKLTNILLIGDFNYREIKWDTRHNTRQP